MQRTFARRAITKVLVANRGEIACRVLQSARANGIKTVAVYSDADANSMHVAAADEAYRLGPALASESYLNVPKLFEVIKKSGANAIHPGYGFLSENADFCEKVEAAGVKFIGPPPSAIRSMGVKSTSKEIMSAAGVPIIPGYHGTDQSEEGLTVEAKKCGFPLMIKAVLGGGGKGMRICMTEEDFIPQLRAARNEAMKSFNDDDVLLERYVTRPRHVEVQVFADNHGNAVYLYERDCSVQRRHQKIIEEAPAPNISSETRRLIGEAAVRAALAVGYQGAGTVEFIMDDKENFFFMEMNTRLQVEHPVTEAITGQDLVSWQFQVAAGHKLPLVQEDIPFNGHAFESRIYAEDPANNFMPGAGKLVSVTPPKTLARVDTGVQTGDEVSAFYDPMIAKLIVWDKDRASALKKMERKLQEYSIVGLPTNIPFLLALTRSKAFQEGDVHTDFIPEHEKDLFSQHGLNGETQHKSEDVAKACLAKVLLENTSYKSDSPFQNSGPFRVNSDATRTVELVSNDVTYSSSVTYNKDGTFQINDFHASGVLLKNADGDLELKWRVGTAENEQIGRILLVPHDGSSAASFSLFDHATGEMCEWTTPEESFVKLASGSGAEGGSAGATAPMTGNVDQVLVKAGDEVKAGQNLIIMIAMKMEHSIKAPADGTIERVLYTVGQTVDKGAPLVKFQETAAVATE